MRTLEGVIYRRNEYSLWAYSTLLEWHALAGLFLLLAALWPPLAAMSLVLWSLTLVSAGRSAWRAQLPQGAPRWTRPLVFAMHVLQPVIRSWHRYWYRLNHKSLPKTAVSKAEYKAQIKRVSLLSWDLYWSSDCAKGRDVLLPALVEQAKSAGWTEDYDGGWHAWDMELQGDLLHDLTVHTVSEELGNSHRFTRARCTVKPTPLARVAAGVGAVWAGMALVTWTPWAMILGLGVLLVLLGGALVSRWQCLRAVTKLVWRAGQQEGLEPVWFKRVPTKRRAVKARPVVGEELELQAVR